jgi:hypothetical protein
MMIDIIQCKRILESDDSEAHLKLLCELDVALTKAHKIELTNILGKYLHQLDQGNDNVTFILGDLLGEHFDLRHSKHLLLKEAKNALYGEGKKASLYGLYRAYGKTRYVGYLIALNQGLLDPDFHVSQFSRWLLNRIEDGVYG